MPSTLSEMRGGHQTGLAGSAAGQKSMALAEFGQIKVLEKKNISPYYSCDLVALPKYLWAFLH